MPDHEQIPGGTDAKSPRNSIGWGLLLGLAILISHLAFLLVPSGMILVFFPGVTQWLVVGPIAVYWWRNAHRESAKGLLIFAALVSLANAACCGILLADGF